MSHGTEHHLEEAEHAQHAQHDPFDKRVAMTIAIIAACLACVSMASHRAHNDTMIEQLEANNSWSYQNTKKTRHHLYKVFSEVVPVLGTTPDAASKAKSLEAAVQQYQEDADQEEAKARAHEKAARHAHEQSTFYDSGQLGLELGLVLCSIAVLSKQRWFWFSGIAVAIVGFAVATYGLMLGWQPAPAGGDAHATLRTPLPPGRADGGGPQRMS
jgi:hypothetical protein